MKKYVPYDKRSKKSKRALDLERRGSWGELSPITRKTKNLKLYDRNKHRNSQDCESGVFCLVI